MKETVFTKRRQEIDDIISGVNKNKKLSFIYYPNIKSKIEFVEGPGKIDLYTMLNFEPYTRTYMCIELSALYHKFDVPCPRWVSQMINYPNVYTILAVKHGIEEVSDDVTEYNSINDTSFNSFDEMLKDIKSKSNIIGDVSEKKEDTTKKTTSGKSKKEEVTSSYNDFVLNDFVINALTKFKKENNHE